MRIITRYVLSDLVGVFVTTLLGMTTIIFVALVAKEAVDRGMGLALIVRIVPYILPQAMQYALPAALLLAVTNVYGRMAAYNEIIALKSLGVSPWSVAWPTLAFAGAVSLGAVAVNDVAVSWGRMGVERVGIESLEEVILGQLRVHRAFTHPKFSITVRRVEGRRLIQPTVTLRESDRDEPRNFTSDWAELAKVAGGGRLVVRMHDLVIDGSGEFTYADPTTPEEVVDLEALLGVSADQNRSPSTYALAEIGPALAETRAEIRQIHNDMSARAAYAMLTGEFQQVSQPVWRQKQQQLGAAEYTLHRLHAEPHRRWAGGFACLAFAMVGVPVAMMMRKSEFLASFFVCFLPILIVYYPLLIVSVNEAKGGGLPPAAVWLGNTVLALAGLALLSAVARDRTRVLAVAGSVMTALLPRRLAGRSAA